jgi:hypothetical protein
MDHSQFKANQTAAIYVADGLDEHTLEEFEMHMMGCQECVEDVEAWRAIKVNVPRRTVRPASTPAVAVRHGYPMMGWRMAASLVIGGILGATGGWLGHAVQTADIDSAQTVFFNVPAVTRAGDECTPLRLAADSRFAVLRVSGVARDLRVVAMDSERHELPTSAYTSRVQPDGSQLVRFQAQLLQDRAVHLQAKGPDGISEPLGCVTGEVGGSR